MTVLLPILGVYELATFQMKPGGPALWGDAFKRAVNAHVALGYTKLVGVFHTEYGALNRGKIIYFFYETKMNISLKFLGSICLSFSLWCLF